ncbi:MAG: sulfur carrier protein ThiS [Mycobacteriaceae bacterium]
MKVLLNGSPHHVDDGATVTELVARAGAPATGVAVAVDGAVLPRSQWSQTVVEGSTVEILTAVQGG